MDEHAKALLTLTEAAGDSGDWIGASEALVLVARTLTESAAMKALTARAFSGMLRTKATRIKFGSEVEDDFPLPENFWLPDHFNSDWDMGDFTAIHGNAWKRAYGVHFHRQDLEKNFPGLFLVQGQSSAAPAEEATRGRRMSELWPNWVAELVLHIEVAGFPDGIGAAGQDEIINAVAERLSKRGLEGPTRSTVQATVKAVLRRKREADK